MYLCFDHAAKSDQWKFLSNMYLSHGNCEICGETVDCIDSHPDKNIVKPVSDGDLSKLRNQYLSDPVIIEAFTAIHKLKLTNVPKKVIYTFDGDISIVYEDSVMKIIQECKSTILNRVELLYEALKLRHN